MAVLEDAVRKTLNTEEVSLVQCSDAKNQESTRVILYHLKNKMTDKGTAQTIGITKITGPDGALYVKVYKRPKVELFTFDADGNIVPMEFNPMEDPELQRIIGFMRKDKKTEEEIQEFISDWSNQPKKGEAPLFAEDGEPKEEISSGRAAEKEEMRRQREKLKEEIKTKSLE